MTEDERKQRARDKAKAYYEANREKCIADRKAWAERNRERVRQNQKRWRDANKERAKEIRRKWAEANPDQVREINQRYYQNNKERISRQAKLWRQANPEKWALILKANRHKREARKRGLPCFHVINKDLRRLLSSPCAVPGCKRSDIQIDHVVPISRGGSHGIGNLQPLCGSHNAAKHARLWIEFRVYLQRNTCEKRTA